jgi:hypothetical protein
LFYCDERISNSKITATTALSVLQLENRLFLRPTNPYLRPVGRELFASLEEVTQDIVSNAPNERYDPVVRRLIHLLLHFLPSFASLSSRQRLQSLELLDRDHHDNRSSVLVNGDGLRSR